MQLGYIRPRVADAGVRIFDRPLHPEFLNICSAGKVATSRFSASVMICDTGHVAQFTVGKETIAEALVPKDVDLPGAGLCRHQRLQQGSETFLEMEGAVRYYFAGHIDRVDADTFARLNLELDGDARRSFLAFRFPSLSRLAPGPVSVIKVEGTSSSLIVHCFHTFPEELCILRTQTLFEIQE